MLFLRTTVTIYHQVWFNFPTLGLHDYIMYCIVFVCVSVCMLACIFAQPWQDQLLILFLLVSFLFIKGEGHTIAECCQETNDGYLTATPVQFFDGLFHRLGGNGKTQWLRATCHVCKNVKVTWPNCQTKIKPYKMIQNEGQQTSLARSWF